MDGYIERMVPLISSVVKSELRAAEAISIKRPVDHESFSVSVTNICARVM